MLKRLHQIQDHIRQLLATDYGRMFLAGMVVTVGGTIIVVATQRPFPMGFVVLAGACLALYSAWKGSSNADA